MILSGATWPCAPLGSSQVALISNRESPPLPSPLPYLCPPKRSQGDHTWAEVLTQTLTYNLWIFTMFFGSIYTPFTWTPAIRLVNEKGKHTCTQEIISSSCPRLKPGTPTHTHTHPSVLMQRVSGPELKQRELVRDGAGAQNGITGEEEEGGRQGPRQWRGPLSAFQWTCEQKPGQTVGPAA